jgi:hypothetical protein
MTEMASIEGEDLVIRVPIAALADAAKVAFDEEYGLEQHDCRVADPRKAAKAVLRVLNSEDEQGSTPVHGLLDKAVIVSFEEGDEGFEGGEL